MAELELKTPEYLMRRKTFDFSHIDLVYEKELGIPAETLIRFSEITFANPPKKKGCIVNRQCNP